jgi:hypothetical protein
VIRKHIGFGYIAAEQAQRRNAPDRRYFKLPSAVRRARGRDWRSRQTGAFIALKLPNAAR